LQDEYQRIAELRQKAAAIEGKHSESKKENLELIHRKRTLLEKAARMREEVDKAARERDSTNQKVQDLKAKIDGIMNEVSELRTKAEEKDLELNGLRAKLTGDEGQMSKKLKELEWELITAGASAKEESAIVTSIAELKRKLVSYECANKAAKELRAIRGQAIKLKDDLRCLLEEKRRLVDEAHMLHDRLLKLRDERTSVLRDVANIREGVAKLMVQADKGLMDLVSANAEIHVLQTKLRRDKDEKIQERQQLELTMRSRVAQLAAEKLKKGESLSWDEFKIYMENGPHE
jgi:uncharacterized coiled-coil DUF342 family protein